MGTADTGACPQGYRRVPDALWVELHAREPGACVPMVAWPLFAEQRLNAVMLADGGGAAIRLPERKDKETIASGGEGADGRGRERCHGAGERPVRLGWFDL